MSLIGPHLQMKRTNSINTAEFFLVTLPGLEDVVLAEAKEWFPDLEMKAEHGGVTATATLEQGLSMNLVLKTPTRILLRVKRFRCRDFPTLYKTIATFSWRNWILATQSMEVQVSSRTSRVKMKKRVEETCQDAWVEFQSRSGSKPAVGKSFTLYVRLVNDECTLSLDTSGERLHKRGGRKHIGDAPLRETIAASLLQWAGRLASADTEIEIVDPMMGSGTFLLEAALRDQPTEAREFAFDTFARAPRSIPRLSADRPKFSSFVGFERDASALAAARTNLQALGRQNVAVKSQDFFTADALPSKSHARWIFSNPPYGERLKIDGEPSAFYEKLFAASERVIQPQRACFLLPAAATKRKLTFPKAWKLVAKRSFSNGGIPVEALLFAHR